MSESEGEIESREQALSSIRALLGPDPTPPVYDDEGNYLYQGDGIPEAHRTVGEHRSWSHDVDQWCYPGLPCTACVAPIDRSDIVKALGPRHSKETPVSDFTTIIGLREALAAFHFEIPLAVNGRAPTGLCSYRGYYEDLAIDCDPTVRHEATELDERPEPWEHDVPFMPSPYHAGHQVIRIKHEPTVGEMVKALDLAIGATFEGYKGGQFTMERGTRLWVSRYGTTDSHQVVDVVYTPESTPASERVNVVSAFVRV